MSSSPDQIRGFLLARGLVFAKRPANLCREMPLVFEDAEANLTPRLRRQATVGPSVCAEWYSDLTIMLIR